jgi:hypothetical protein
MRRLMVMAGLAGVLVLAATAAATPNAAIVRIDFRHSNCLQVPDLRQVRFFVELVNPGDSPGAFRSDIHFAWLQVKGGWKEALSVLKGGQLRVGAHSRKLYYIDLTADPAKLITACGVRIGSSSAVHHIRVLVPRPAGER